MLSFFSNTSVGVEITDHEIKILTLKKIRKKPFIQKIATKPLPKGVVQQGRINQPLVAGEILQSMVKNLQVRRHCAALALPMQRVMTRRVQLPRGLDVVAAKAEVEAHLYQYLPDVREPVSFDLAKLPTIQDAAQDSFFLAAVHTETLENYLTVAAYAKLALRLIDIDLYAAAYAVAVNDKCQSFIVFEMDATTSRCIVLHEKEIIFHRQWCSPQPDPFVWNQTLQECFSQHAYLQPEKIYFSGAEYFLSLLKNIISLPIIHLPEKNNLVCLGLALRGTCDAGN